MNVQNSNDASDEQLERDDFDDTVNPRQTASTYQVKQIIAIAQLVHLLIVQVVN